MPRDEWLVDCLPAIWERLIPTLFWWIFMACLLSCLLPPSIPHTSWRRRFMACSFSVDWMQLALLQQRTNRYICFTGWEKWVWRNCTTTSLCNKGALKNADFFFMKWLYSPSWPSLIFLSEERAKKEKRFGERKKYMACNSAEIRFFILITKEANEGISLVFILDRCDFLLFANT